MNSDNTFYRYKKYGISLVLIGVASFLYMSNKTTSAEEFNGMYEKHVSEEDKSTCRDKTLICKEFYLGHALFGNNPKLSLKYLKNSYENNITSLIDDWSARDSYITGDIARAYANMGDYKSAIVYAKKSIEAGEPSSCELGRYYDKLDMLAKAKEAFEKSIQFYECKFNLGNFYYNGRGVKQDKVRAVELWKGSYKDDSFGKNINYNLAMYYANETRDLQKYKYHLLKAALLGKKEARFNLDKKDLKGISSSDIFINEAVSKHFYYTPDIKGYKFSYGFNLYYRFKEFYDKSSLWQENYEQKDAVEFEKNNIKIRFELQELNVKANLKTNSIREFIKAVELVILSLHVDTKNIKLYTYLSDLQKKFEDKNSFDMTKQVQDKYHFSWQVAYENKSDFIEFLLKIEE